MSKPKTLSKSKADVSRKINVEAPGAPVKKRGKRVKASDLEEDSLVKELFRELEEKQTSVVVTLEGVVEKVYTGYGGKLVLQVPVQDLSQALWSRFLLDLPVKDKTHFYPWTTADGVATLNLAPSGIAKFSFEEMFEALKDESASYGYGKKGATVKVEVLVSTYAGFPDENTVGISMKLAKPIELLSEEESSQLELPVKE